MTIPASEFLGFLKSMAESAPAPRTLAEFRGQFDGLTSGMQTPDGVHSQDIRMGGVAVLRQSPDGSASDVALIYCHGGGYVLGNTETHAHLTSHLALQTDATVYSVDYRLAPEHPWPAAIEDVCSVYEELLRESRAPDRTFFAGDSAGGGLAVSAALEAKRRGLPMPAGLVLLSPWCDLSNSGWSQGALRERDSICNSAILTTCAAYYTGGIDPGDGAKSALFGDLADLPPILIHVGSEEVLLSDSTRLAERAGAAGVPVELKVWPRMPHVFQLFVDHLDDARTSIGQIANWIHSRASSH